MKILRELRIQELRNRDKDFRGKLSEDLKLQLLEAPRMSNLALDET